MPKPHAGEKFEDYMDRAMPIFISEGLTEKQARGKATGWWNHVQKAEGGGFKEVKSKRGHLRPKVNYQKHRLR